MARRKNQPESVRVKCRLAERLREIRVELFGERGGSEMARRLGLPIRTWYNYEAGVTVPAEVLLRFVELTAVEPLWLLHGEGPRFRNDPPPRGDSGDPTATVESLLRAALQHLERRGAVSSGRKARHDEDDVPLHASPCGPAFAEDRQAWLEARTDGRIVRVRDDAMTPIVSEGAEVAYEGGTESAEALDGKIVVAWFEGQPLVRWFRHSGRYGVLRAENPDHAPSLVLLDLGDPHEPPRIHRVLWICTPH